MKHLTVKILILLSILTLLIIGCSESKTNISNPGDDNQIPEGSTYITPKMIGLKHYECMKNADSFMRYQYSQDKDLFVAKFDSIFYLSLDIAHDVYALDYSEMSYTDFKNYVNATPPSGFGTKAGMLSVLDELKDSNCIDIATYNQMISFINTLYYKINISGFYAAANYLDNLYQPVKDINIYHHSNYFLYATYGFFYYSFLGTGTYMTPIDMPQGQFGVDPGGSTVLNEIDWGGVFGADADGFLRAASRYRTPGENLDPQEGEVGAAVGEGVCASIDNYKTQKAQEVDAITHAF